ncbi:MAG TPA: hypothetical protein VN408_15880 [Actinoplanes sp.]|nr:hypothetical protein [Actinoplanes sp.]
MRHHHERSREVNTGTPRPGGRNIPAPDTDRLSPADVAGLQQRAGNEAVSRLIAQRSGGRVQRMMTDETAEEHEPAHMDRPVSPEGVADPKFQLSNAMAENTIRQKGKKSRWDYVVDLWHSVPEYRAERHRLRDILDRRVVQGRAFSERETALIRQLSTEDPQWLTAIGIGTYQDAYRLAMGQDPAKYKNWLREPAGKRVLAASIAYAEHQKTPDAPTPIDPAYTHGRFMHTQQLTTGDERTRLEDERNAQIRKTAADTLHPEGLDASELAAGPVTAGQRKQAADASGILTNVLQVLHAGLEVRKADGTYARYEGDVIRALAHGGRVNIRVPALSGDENAGQLLEHLGVLQNGKRAAGVKRRAGATHYTAIGKNTAEARGSFVEKGGGKAGARNALAHGGGYAWEWASDGVSHLFQADPPERAATELMSTDIAGGGVGAKDWNGDVILPGGSHGHMLLVWSPPSADQDGSLLVGIETLAMGAASPVGYKHGITSTEATANPESVFHGHKQDKIGEGKTKDNTRMVDLAALNSADRGWLDVLQEMKRNWADSLEGLSTEQTRARYEQLVGPQGGL